MNGQTLRRIRDLPGPPGWPVLGNSIQIERARVHHDVERWAKLYGPSLRMRLGRRDQLVIDDHALLSVAMRDRPDGFERSPLSRAIGVEMRLPQGVSCADAKTGCTSAAW